MKIETIAAVDFAAQSMRPVRPDSSDGHKSRIREVTGDSRQDQSGSGILKESENKEDKVSPSEVLDRIKELTGDGFYSVRFEKSMEYDQIVVKVVDRATEEVIREVPPEELLKVKAQLTEFSGNIFNSVS